MTLNHPTSDGTLYQTYLGLQNNQESLNSYREVLRDIGNGMTFIVSTNVSHCRSLVYTKFAPFDRTSLFKGRVQIRVPLSDHEIKFDTDLKGEEAKNPWLRAAVRETEREEHMFDRYGLYYFQRLLQAHLHSLQPEKLLFPA